MWFIWLATGLALLVVSGWYVRRRVVSAAARLGAGPRGQAALRWLILWLLVAYPVIMFTTIGVALLLGREQMGGFEHPLVTWGLVLPFFLTVLVVLQALPYLLLLDLVHWLRRWRRRRRNVRPSPVAPTMSRRHALGVVAAVAVCAIYTPARILWERDELRWRSYRVEAPARTESAGEPGRPPPFRIAFIADLQQDVHTDHARAASIIERLNAQQPDIVLSGGDWINTGPHHIAAAARSAGQARSRLGTFSVLGDHEHFAYFDRQRSAAEVTAAMRAQGVAMLDNEVRRFEHHGRTIAVIFLTYSYPARTPDAEIARLIASVQDADLSVLVTHQFNRDIADLARDRIDLVLAAHTHGGQVNPLVGLWHLPLARLETPYVDGRFQLGATTLIVTAGIGYSIVPFRYASVGSVETIDVTW